MENFIFCAVLAFESQFSTENRYGWSHWLLHGKNYFSGRTGRKFIENVFALKSSLHVSWEKDFLAVTYSVTTPLEGWIQHELSQTFLELLVKIYLR